MNLCTVNLTTAKKKIVLKEQAGNPLEMESSTLKCKFFCWCEESGIAMTVAYGPILRQRSELSFQLHYFTSSIKYLLVLKSVENRCALLIFSSMENRPSSRKIVVGYASSFSFGARLFNHLLLDFSCQHFFVACFFLQIVLFQYKNTTAICNASTNAE